MGNELQPSAAVASPATDLGTTRASFKVTLKFPLSALLRMRSGAKWFYWVAGLSLANTLLLFSGGRLHFLLGLGATQFVDDLGRKSGAGSHALLLDVLISGVFALIGVFASRCSQFTFGLGMLLYAADGALLVLLHDWFSLAFHALVLCFMYRGFSAAWELRGVANLNHAKARAEG